MKHALQLFIGVFLFCGGWILPAQSQTKIGETLETKTRVSGSIGKRALRTGADIFARETLSSNRTGLGQFKLNDGTLLALGANARLKMTKAIYGGNSKSFTELALTNTAGAVRFISGKSTSSAYKIKTPVAVLGVRGTAFDVQMLRGRFYLMLLNGQLEVCNNAGVCKLLKRRCECAVVHLDGRIDGGFLPRNGIYKKEDMEKFFPFVFDQSQLRPEFQVSLARCASGNKDDAYGDSSGPSADPGPAPSGYSGTSL